MAYCSSLDGVSHYRTRVYARTRSDTLSSNSLKAMTRSHYTRSVRRSVNGVVAFNEFDDNGRERFQRRRCSSVSFSNCNAPTPLVRFVVDLSWTCTNPEQIEPMEFEQMVCKHYVLAVHRRYCADCNEVESQAEFFKNCGWLEKKFG